MSRSMIQSVLTFLLIFAFANAEAAESRIFKTVDEDGNVVFTDIPPREVDSGEQIVVETPNSFAIEEAIGPREGWVVEPTEEDEEVAFSYKSLVIASPTDDEALRENAGNVSVVAVVNPRLQRGHRIRLMMDGQQIQEGIQSSFNLENVDRGTHNLTMEIIDDSGRVLISSGNTTFHLQRYRIPTPRPSPS